MISGSVRLVYAVLYSLFLGFGIACVKQASQTLRVQNGFELTLSDWSFSMGSEIYIRITGLPVAGSTDYTCNALRLNAPWYRATISPWFYFFTAPCYLLALSLRNGQPLLRKETIYMVAVGCAGVSRIAI
jgi:hypothetical protein